MSTTGKDFVEISSTEESNEIELEVREKLNQIIDDVTENIDIPVSEKMDSIRSNIDDFKDRLRASFADIIQTESNGGEKEQCCDETNESELKVERNGDVETLDVEKALSDNLTHEPSSFVVYTGNLTNGPSTSDANINENIDFCSPTSDHGYNRAEPPAKKAKTTDVKIQDIAASFLMLGENKRSKKRKELDSSNSRTNENDVNPSNIKTKPAKQRRFPIFCNKPANVSSRCLEPFKKGWKRELVRRKPVTSETTQSVIPADVYYFSPLGVKLRSYREVAEYLKEVNEDSLSLDCFSYKKVLIYKQPEETERNAGEIGVSKGSKFKRRNATPSNTNGPSYASKDSSKASSKSSKSPKKPKPQLSLMSKIKKIGIVNKKINSNIKKAKLSSVPCSLSCPGQQGVVPSLLCDVCLCMFHPKCVNLLNNEVSFICIKCIYQRTYKNKKPKRKLIAEGTQLQAKDANNKNDADMEVSDSETLVSVESPVSVEVRTSIISNNNDIKKIKVAPSQHVLPRLTAAPAGPKTYSKIESETNRPLPTLKRAPFALNHPLKTVKMSGTWVPPQLPQKTIQLRHPPPLKMVTLLRKNINGGTAINRPPPPLIQQRSMMPVSSQSQILMVPMTAPSVSNILQPNSPNVPASKSTTLPLNLTMSPVAASSVTVTSPKPGVVTMINNMVINNMVMNNVGTMKFRLKPNGGDETEVLVPEIKPTNAATPPQPKFIVTDEFGKPKGLVVGFGNSVIQLPILNKLDSFQHETTGGIISVPLPNSRSSIVMPKLLTSAATNLEEVKKPQVVELTKEGETQNDGDVKVLQMDNGWDLKKVSFEEEPTETSKLKKPDVVAVVRSIQRCFAGTTVLLNVFEYLTHEDLSRARCVCKSWNWWASQSVLWKCIDLSGTCVHDWNKLAGLIKQFKSTRLDLRKMKVFEDQNRTWHCFLLVLKDLETIEHIDFGYIPGAFLQPIARSLTRLKVLTAEWIVEYSNNNCRLDFGIFGKLKSLSKLRLRGISGLQVQNITTEGLSFLADLTQLVHLSITTLRDAPASDFEVIKSLKQLKELDLGDCKNWTTETYNYLGELTELERLRLEVGTAFPDNLCYSSLSKLTKLNYLELNDFHINNNLLLVLEHLPQLEHLNILPNCRQNSGKTNTAIFNGLQVLKNLKVLEWKILTTATSKSTNVNSTSNFDNDSLDETRILPSSDNNCKSKRDKDVIKENDACIPIVLNGAARCITIEELWEKVQTVCSNVIFH
uniref:MBD domain-containing protein n=1 Tax=Strigamia maritima TaxID=126957 RepID=T1JCQ3_STRMM